MRTHLLHTRLLFLEFGGMQSVEEWLGRTGVGRPSSVFVVNLCVSSVMISSMLIVDFVDLRASIICNACLPYLFPPWSPPNRRQNPRAPVSSYFPGPRDPPNRVGRPSETSQDPQNAWEVLQIQFSQPSCLNPIRLFPQDTDYENNLPPS
jgi:hypothetical protein